MKRRLVLTISVFILTIDTAVITVSYLTLQSQFNSIIERKLNLISRYYDGLTEHETYQLRATLKTLRRNREIMEAFRSRDRDRLLKLTASLYSQLHSDHEVTHFYFTGPDRINILRVHNPDRFGDTINRQTTLSAERTGREAAGLELGPFGTFTLRVVTPWFDGDELIGYLELGKEVEHAIEEMRKLLDIEIFAFIDKKYIVRGGWEEGLEMLGRKADWDRFRASVNIGESIDGIPPSVLDFLAEDQPSKDYRSVDFKMDGKTYRTRYIPLIDVNNLVVGHISVLIDITDSVRTFYRYILLVSSICIFTGALLILTCHIILSRSESKMNGSA